MEKKGNALPFVLLFLLITGIISSLLVHLTWTALNFDKKTAFAKEAAIEMEKFRRAELLLFAADNYPRGIRKLINNNFELTNTLRPFGLFVWYRSVLTRGKNSYREEGLLGNVRYPAGSGKTAFIHTRDNYPVLFGKEVNVKGDFIFSSKGFETETGRNVLNGKIKVNNNEIRLDKSLWSRLKAFMDSMISEPSGRAEKRDSVFRSTSLSRELARGNTVIRGPAFIRADIPFSGRKKFEFRDFVIIYSENKIVIPENVNSVYSIFVSDKKIEIRGGIHQSQFWAPIIVSRADTLFFPSFLISGMNSSGEIFLNGVIEGGIIVFGNENITAKKNVLSFGKEAEVEGVVICEGGISFPAAIRGTLFFSSSYQYISPTDYFNLIHHLQLKAVTGEKILPLFVNYKPEYKAVYYR